MDRRTALKTGAAAVGTVALTALGVEAAEPHRYEKLIVEGKSITVINPKHICFVEQNQAGKTLIHMSGSTIETKVTIQQILDQLKENDGKWLEIVE